jgi:periplasmic divalent cation tolerance protein
MSSSNFAIATVAACGMMLFLSTLRKNNASLVSGGGLGEGGEFVILYVTVPNKEVGEKIATHLVNEKRAACVNVIDGVKSYYRWQGKVEIDNEQLLVIKSRKTLFSLIQESVEKLHPYDTPEIVSFPLHDISPKYRKWLGDSTDI